MADETLNSIRAGMAALLQEKAYIDIQMTEIAEKAGVARRTLYRYFDNKEQILQNIAGSLMDRFAEEIAQHDEMTLYSAAHAFFLFIERNRSEFTLLKKAHLLTFIEEPLIDLMMQLTDRYKAAAAKASSRGSKPSLGEDWYALQFTIAGFWRTALLWLEDDNGLTAEQMAQIAGRIMRRN